MPPKVYVPAYPEGDFRAMPALGAGHALLKWVTSFPGNPAQGLPTVTGLVLLSDARNGMPRAVLDAGAVTSLRTGAAAVLAAETLGRSNAETAAVIGVGVNGEAAARTFLARGRRVQLWDIDRARTESVAERIGAEVAPGRDEALEPADLLVTVTPGQNILLDEGSLRPGQHVSLMGADGPGKAEIAVEELARVRVFCDDWEQTSHNGELVHGTRGRQARVGRTSPSSGRCWPAMPREGATPTRRPCSTRPVSRFGTWRSHSPRWSRRLRWTYGRSSSSSRVRSEHRGGVRALGPGSCSRGCGSRLGGVELAASVYGREPRAFIRRVRRGSDDLTGAEALQTFDVMVEQAKLLRLVADSPVARPRPELQWHTVEGYLPGRVERLRIS